MDGKALVFLNGSYSTGDAKLVRELLRRTRPRPMVIAVDGGIGFLQKIGRKPDVWISDLDSAPRMRRGFLRGVDLLFYSPAKDKTDAELAVDLCVLEGVSEVTLLGWSLRGTETDHLLGNLFLCRRLGGKTGRMRFRFLDSRQEVIPVIDGKHILNGYVGRRLSILPLSQKMSLTLTGTAYRAKNLTVHAGQTVAMRNIITANRATIAVKGTALAVIL
jgi:thiamine pyrophosphokinase